MLTPDDIELGFVNDTLFTQQPELAGRHAAARGQA
jgi:hypothetical protein